MNEPLAVMGTPGVGFFAMLIIGAIAGWIAERVTSSNHGLLTNIIVGIAGSFVGVRLAEAMNIVVSGTIGHIIAATIGAIGIIFIWRAITRQSQG